MQLAFIPYYQQVYSSSFYRAVIKPQDYPCLQQDKSLHFQRRASKSFKFFSTEELFCITDFILLYELTIQKNQNHIHLQYINLENLIREMQDINSKQKDCPYLSTIKKHLLDFDFQKVCSITLAHTNIYCCLVCGRYFQGRSSKTPAYQHSIEFSHYIFINMQTSKVYCLPDDYQVDAYTLSDIKFNLKPEFTPQLLTELENFKKKYYSIDAKEFTPGVVGMNNLIKTDYATAVIYLMNSIDDIRRYFLLNKQLKHPLLSEFSILLKKIWNPKNFKGIVSPHDFLQLVSNLSDKKFKIGHQSDPTNFLLWLIDNFSRASRKQKQGLNFQKLFKGKLKLSIIKGIKDSYEYQSIPSKIDEVSFNILKMEFPEKGIFNKSQNKISIKSLLQKYLGRQGQKHQQGLRYAKITDFPLYLILVFKRFSFNGYLMEKDSTELIYQNHLQIQISSKIIKYHLKSQICHEGDYERGAFKSMFRIHKKWFQVQNLDAQQIPLQEVQLSQPIIQVYELIRQQM